VSLVIRAACSAHLDAINDIYNHYVVRSTCTYQYAPTTRDERRAWFENRDAAHPVTVATDGSEILGYGALGPFRPREGYRFTVENAVYVRHDAHRRGIGRTLLVDLVTRAATLGHRSIIAGISAEQAGSVALHAAFGFVEVGRIRNVAVKFDQWLDLLFMQRVL